MLEPLIQSELPRGMGGGRWTWSINGPSFLPSPLGLQDKLNKRDKEVTALTNQTEMLRAQVSGKSPSRRADARAFLGASTSGPWRGLASRLGAQLHSALRRRWPGPVHLHWTSMGSREWGNSTPFMVHNRLGDPSQLLLPAAMLF